MGGFLAGRPFMGAFSQIRQEPSPVGRGGMAEKTAKCEAYAKIGSLI